MQYDNKKLEKRILDLEDNVQLNKELMKDLYKFIERELGVVKQVDE